MLFFSPPSITFSTKHSLVPYDLIKLQHIVLFKSSHLLHGAGMQHRGAVQAGAHIQLTACFQASSLTQHVILQLTSCMIFPGEQAELFEILRRWHAPPPPCLHLSHQPVCISAVLEPIFLAGFFRNSLSKLSLFPPHLLHAIPCSGHGHLLPNHPSLPLHPRNWFIH